MKSEERIAQKYFESNNYSNIIFEPIGNTPPDFSINGIIGAEVRRLNKYLNGKPLEKEDYNVIPKIENYIQSHDFNWDAVNTTIVTLYYSRPIKFNDEIKQYIKKALETFLKNPEIKYECFINNNLSIGLFQIEEKWDSQFEVHGYVDLDKGGQVSSDISNSLKIIITEKEQKIEKFKKYYDEWWLVLIDYIGYGINLEMAQRIKAGIDVEHSFSKILFISPSSPYISTTINFP